jgi:hypothetical protein
MQLIQSEKPITTNHPKLGKLECFASTPQATSNADFGNYVGGDEKLLDWCNSHLDTDAKNAGRAYLRTYDGDNVEEAYKRVREIVSSYSPAAERERAATQKVKAQALDAITAAVKAGKKLDTHVLEEMLKGLNVLT